MDFYKDRVKAFYGTTMENVRKRSKKNLMEKDKEKEIIKEQSNLNFKGTHKN